MARILVADDEAGIREFIHDTLELDGHAVTLAQDGHEAAAQLDSSGFDLLVTDLKMPGLDGMALLRKVRAEQPEMEALVLTAHGTIDTAVEAMRLGAFDYLRKPLSGPDELRLVVSRALERRGLKNREEGAALDERGPALGYGDPAMAPVVDAIGKVARTSATVLLLGESGTGKEVAARAIHAQSPRAAGPFMAVNCAALTETLLESELFGHEKGAFTGATERRRGRLELADGGTFFLDEVGELKPELQAKLLRVLQERRFERVGGTRTLEIDVRWVAATNRDLDAMRAEGRFRDDLYHRLSVFPIQLPALRERPADIVPLARVLLARISRELKRPGLQLSPGAERQLALGRWPGNVRELANVLERAAILSETALIGEEHLGVPGSTVAPPPPSSVEPAGAVRSLAELEREAIARALAAVGGNRRRAAELLGIGERTLYDKLKRYGLEA
ncbi:sigma-54-dependent Fis family transcriptional regulator [Aggregicoccus sp. 17bor-14]|uniref:sigma-54-dependent transcriptional regulator n=1 Tax=Myxococcaceae TaxID=31 RepID=UPI00129C2C8D|nr:MULTISPECIES: sigma-54 dependent transcriptional regulator [Myxococcaceae]MBF5043054.1 sigma-54-dependent Fis family transcriptional regulator [Simulacricoccus sp. 17bor-14]MRI88817.1 sigma-54-dependent Fis family transcriptional regulator [Aggregicoccus sp. 17bor-14]